MSKIKRCTTRRNKAKWTPSSAKRIAQGWRGGGEQPLGLGGCHKGILELIFMAKKKNEPLRQRTKLEFVRVESPKFKSWEDLCNGAKDGRHLLVHTDSMCSFGYYLCTNGQEEYGKRETQTGNYYGELIDEYLRSHFIGGNRDRNFPNKLAITIETVCKDTKDRPIRRSKGKPKPLSLEEEFNEWYAQNRRIYGEYDDFVERERGRCEGSCRHQYD